MSSKRYDFTKKWIYKDEGENGTIVMPDGSLRAVGSAMVWDDIAGNLFGKSIYSPSGKIDYNWVENTITFQSAGSIKNLADRIQFNLQFPHATYFGPGSTVGLHIHWLQDSVVPRIFTIQYKIQRNGEAYETTWEEIIVDTNVNPIYSYTSGTINQISELVEIDLLGYRLSDILQIRMARTDSEVGDCEVTFVDAHIMLDSDGSQDEYVK
jgi:hypothetical protein